MTILPACFHWGQQYSEKQMMLQLLGFTSHVSFLIGVCIGLDFRPDDKQLTKIKHLDILGFSPNKSNIFYELWVVSKTFCEFGHELMTMIML